MDVIITKIQHVNNLSFLSIPLYVGVDAMVHAIEAYTSKHKKNLVSDVLAREALALLSSNIRSHFVTIAWKMTLYT